MVQPLFGAEPAVSLAVATVFNRHGVRTVRAEGLRRGFWAWLLRSPFVRYTFPDHPGLWVEGTAYREAGLHEMVAQIDVRLGLPGRRVLVDTFAGIGDDPAAQMADGVMRFATCTLHALLAAFFGQRIGDQGEQATWAIGGEPRTVVLGPAVSRFGAPPDYDSWFDRFRTAVCAERLPPGDHWVRLYQMRNGPEAVCNEVFLDNAQWPAVQDALGGFDWPDNGGRYDVRLFLVIRAVGAG